MSYPVHRSANGHTTLIAAPPAALHVLTPTPPTFYTALPRYAAVIDGPMFDESSSALTVQYRLREAGRVLTPGYGSTRTRGHTLGVANGRASWASGAVDLGATSVQLYPDLVLDRRAIPTDTATSQRVGRAGAGILRDGSVFLAFGHGLTLRGFAQDLVELGAAQAGYTDGGGSTQGYLGDYVYPASEHRPVPSFLALASGGALSTHVGGSRAGLWLLGAGLGAAAWWWFTHEDP